MHQIAKDIAGAGKAEVQVNVAAPLDHVWTVLTDIERWPEITDLYEFAHWTSGDRWEVGSTFEAKITWPFPLTLSHVVTGFRRHSEIRWIVHGIGVVIERWTRLAAVANQTQITSSALFFGTATRELPGHVGDLLTQFTQRFYADMKAACEPKAA